MKIKLMSVLTGAVVLGFAATPFVVKAVTPSSAPQVLAQANTRSGQGRLADLNLTQSQKDQMRQIRERTQEKIKAVLTSDQRRQYESAMSNRSFGQRNNNQDGNYSASGRGGRGFNNPLASLNLSQDQQNQIRQIRRTSREQMNSVLTDAQRAQLQQNRPSGMRNGRSGQYNQYNQYNQ